MKVPNGYCDLRVERVNDDIINTFIECKWRLKLYTKQHILSASVDKADNIISTSQIVD